MNLTLKRTLAAIGTSAALAGTLAIAGPAGATTDSAGTGQAARYRINCGIVTCSLYVSKATTAWANSLPYRGAAKTALGSVCRLAGPGAIPCRIGLKLHTALAERNLKAAAARGGCFVIRYNLVAGRFVGVAAGVSYGNVPLGNRYCDAA